MSTNRSFSNTQTSKLMQLSPNPAPSVFCVGFGDSCINFEVWVFVKDLLVDMMPLSHEIHASITKALGKANIDIPFPQRDIHLHTRPEPAKSD